MPGRLTSTSVHRRALASAGAVAALGLLVSACSTNTNASAPKKSAASQSSPTGSTSPSSSSPSASPTSSAPPPAPKVTARPANGAADVSPASAASVSVTNGTLSGVKLTSSSGATIKLAASADKSKVTVAQELGYDRTYTWSGRAIGAEGRAVAVSGRFHTVAPAVVMHATINISDNQTVGIAAPIIVTFGGHVTDRAAAEKALTVHTSVPTVGSWAWLPDDSGQSRVHWRPERYWKPGTRVSVTASFFGVNYGGGAYGEENVTSKFSIGRSQVVKADVTSYRLKVYRSGKLLFNFPASYGLATDPNRVTPSGTYVVMEKFPVKYMSNPAYGYVNIPEKWAVRFSNYGLFIHDNDATDGVQGAANVTHGCVNLSYDNALAYYKTAIYGDPVEVTGSNIKESAVHGDVYDWSVPWATWKSMSALS
jgi:lipoprotein-anchoring transpeptidase ErfK/SrfK